MLRILLHIINPYKKGQLRKKVSFLQRIRIGLFSGSIRFLSLFYKRYAYVDIVEIGDVKVYHSQRDLLFEQWLFQTKKDVRPHMHTSNSMPSNASNRWWRPYYKFFHMETVTTIIRSKEEISLHRMNGLKMTASLKGQLRLSDKNDIIHRSEFKAGMRKRLGIFEGPPLPQPSPRPKQKKEKISLGDKKPITFPNDDLPIDGTIILEPKVTIKQIQGAEIDESF